MSMFEMERGLKVAAIKQVGFCDYLITDVDGIVHKYRG